MIRADDIAARLGLRRASGGRGWAGDCPACGYRDGLRLNAREGRALWWCASCTDKLVLAEAVTGRHGGSPPRSAQPPGDHATRRAAALRLWDAALPIQGTPAQHYLAMRGLLLPDGTALRFLPDARHPSGARCACMVALAVDGEGRGQAVHRTYLAPGGTGKAKLDPPRATLGPIGGAVVRLCQPREGEALVLGEGIETSLSAGLLTGLPAWAALSAGNMARVTLPDDVRDVWVASDHDAPGQRAAWQAADAFMAQGRTSRVLTPDAHGEDFNDILLRRMAQGVAHG